MADLDATGWDWNVGRQGKYQQIGCEPLYHARAWRDRHKPKVQPVKRVRDFRDIVGACGRTPEEAAARCAKKVRVRLNAVEGE